MGGEGEDPAACAREDAHVCPITTRHRLGRFFFHSLRESGTRLKFGSGIPLLWCFSVRVRSSCRHRRHRTPPPAPTSILRRPLRRFTVPKTARKSPPRTVTWLTCRFLRETAVPSSGRKTLPTKGVELENATTDTEAGANLVGPPGQENVFGAGQLFPERSKRSFIVQHPSYQCFQTMKLQRSQEKPPF